MFRGPDGLHRLLRAETLHLSWSLVLHARQSVGRFAPGTWIPRRFCHLRQWQPVSAYKTGEPYRVLVAYENDEIRAIQENYHLSTNDSTRRLWQQLRDGLEKELDAWPNCPILKDDHKKADFETDGGFVSVILENTYKPTLMVLYHVKKEKKQ